MKSISEKLFCRGKANTCYLRIRIPTALLAAYPVGKKEIVLSLGTSDQAKARRQLHIEMVRIDSEFAEHARILKERRDLSTLRHVQSLTEEQLQGLARFWVRQVLLNDKQARSQGMDDGTFEQHGQVIAQQREELGKMLARGQVTRILPAMHSFIHLCGLDVAMSDEQAQKAGYVFLEAVVTGLDHQTALQCGKRVDTDTVAPTAPHPATIAAEPSAGADWDTVFNVWKNFVKDRPKSTIIGNQTPWGQLKRFAAKRNITEPAQLTPKHMAEFVNQMADAGLVVITINGRIGKLKEIFKIAVGKQILTLNPLEKTLGFKASKTQKGEKKRLPFTHDELNVIFNSPVFTQHLRSSGQSEEASYWIPLIMLYTGARPEEIAGLQLSDIQQDATVGWYFHITDLKAEEDAGLFDDEPSSHKKTPEKRMLKNNVSRRKIPVAKELLALGLLRYIDWVRGQDSQMLFPTLRKDFHGKLCGAFSKWFGRYKTELGFATPKKVLYSLRHNMKDFLEAGKVPTKYLKRILGHASGDGTITDGYGSDVPLNHVHEYFSNISFPAIPAKPWQPGLGYWKKAKKSPSHEI